jgi:RimJ/RimL family protein N-acetyltransferase
MRVRSARDEDCGPLARAIESVIEEGRWLATESSVSRAELERRFRAGVESEDTLLFVLEEGEEVIGALGLKPTHAEGVLSLGVWIGADSRGRGGGRSLLEAALAQRPLDVHKIELEVFPDNAAAIGLYHSLGFQQEGLRRDHYKRLDGSLRSALIMARLF